MAKNLKAVRAWAVVNENGRCITVHTEAKFTASNNAKFYAEITPMKYRVKPVVIVPAAEYRAMRAAQKRAALEPYELPDEYCECGHPACPCCSYCFGCRKHICQKCAKTHKHTKARTK